MFSKINRLRKTKEIEKVFKNGTSCRSDFLLLKFFKNSLPVSRFAFVVGQKVSKKATVRNRIKRRIREAVKKELPNINAGLDTVWVALRGLENKNTEEIKKDVKCLLQKAKVCR